MHTESVTCVTALGEDADINYDASSEGSGDMYSSDDEMPQEHWDGGNVDEILTDFDDIDEDMDQSSDENKILSVAQIIFIVWGSFYGISATALNRLIKLFFYLAQNILRTTAFITSFPTSLCMIKKYLRLSRDTFEKYVICEKCGSLYTFKECFVTNTTANSKPKLCNHIAFRNHPHASRRKPCSHHLLKEVILKSQLKYYPRKHTVTSSLLNILKRKGLLDMCEQWRNRKISDTVLTDIYDA